MVETFKATKLKLTDYDVMLTLGTGIYILIILIGSFGRVRLAKDKKTGEYVALKMLKKSEILRLKQVDHIISENTILSNIKHPFLVNLISLYLDFHDWILSRRKISIFCIRICLRR